MIGMINIPSDVVSEFYAEPERSSDRAVFRKFSANKCTVQPISTSNDNLVSQCQRQVDLNYWIILILIIYWIIEFRFFYAKLFSISTFFFMRNTYSPLILRYWSNIKHKIFKLFLVTDKCKVNESKWLALIIPD